MSYELISFFMRINQLMHNSNVNVYKHNLKKIFIYGNQLVAKYTIKL